MLFIRGLDKRWRSSHQGAIQNWCLKTEPFSLPTSLHCDFEDTWRFLALTPLNINVPPDQGWPKPPQRLENSTAFFFFFLWNDINPPLQRTLAQHKWSRGYQPLRWTAPALELHKQSGIPSKVPWSQGAPLSFKARKYILKSWNQFYKHLSLNLETSKNVIFFFSYMIIGNMCAQLPLYFGSICPKMNKPHCSLGWKLPKSPQTCKSKA